jgi:hypothetical protein
VRDKNKKGKTLMANLPSAPSKIVTPIGINQIVTVSADAISSGRAALLATPADQAGPFTALAASATQTWGPYPTVKYLHIEALVGGGVSFTVTPADLNQIEVVGDFSSIRELIGAGAPTDSTTGSGIAGKGSRYTDISAGDIYINTGSAASTTWKKSTHA